ncbi:hemerythrin domain-containing protein [Kitasatospora sp. NPDC056531]|uniref:hemerythrin domain-containing protein n=1 Tax=Kitasatospora sp. NPDC056531 TaxID=3345856 RepID=UPI0036AC3CDF
MNDITTPDPDDAVDLTMMYAAHQAFRRDLARLTSAAKGGTDSDRQAFATGWSLVKSYLTIHHKAEDDALWPAIRRHLPGREQDLATLDALEAEHTELDPLMHAIDTELAGDDAQRLAGLADQLSTALIDHLDHEEAQALPLVVDLLTKQEWSAFGADQRRQLGPEGASTFIPWLLDGASEQTRAAVLATLPPPARGAYQQTWRAAYEQQSPWHPAGR